MTTLECDFMLFCLLILLVFDERQMNSYPRSGSRPASGSATIKRKPPELLASSATGIFLSEARINYEFDRSSDHKLA
jgi:hypothetical protein